jgi:hypothetical protein
MLTISQGGASSFPLSPCGRARASVMVRCPAVLRGSLRSHLRMTAGSRTIGCAVRGWPGTKSPLTRASGHKSSSRPLPQGRGVFTRRPIPFFHSGASRNRASRFALKSPTSSARRSGPRKGGSGSASTLSCLREAGIQEARSCDHRGLGEGRGSRRGCRTRGVKPRETRWTCHTGFGWRRPLTLSI